MPEPEATQLFTSPVSAARKADILFPLATGTAPAFAPVRDLESPVSPVNELNEMAYQYRAMNWWQLIGIVTSVFLMGIPVLVYAILQKPVLLRRVAEYGINAQDWAAPFDREFHRNLTITVALAGVLLGGLITAAILHGTL